MYQILAFNSYSLTISTTYLLGLFHPGTGAIIVLDGNTHTSIGADSIKRNTMYGQSENV